MVRMVCCDEFRNRQVAELTRHLARIEQEAEIGRRDAGGDLGRLFLHVVGNQPVVFLVAE